MTAKRVPTARSRARVQPASQVSIPGFAIASVALVTAAALAEQSGRLDWLRLPTAVASYTVVSALGFSTTLVGCEIVTRHRVLDVATTCIPSGVFAVMLALIVATRASWPKRGAGVLFGAAVMFVANVLRVVAGVAVAQSAPQVFDVVHVVLLQVIPVVAAFAAWFVWARWAHAV